ncbi:MAG: 50S ribosomal protein L21 [Chloroflexi bacterium]|nr:MAG: 50S ribosomal protein L21 [Chloroflexota bacterium]
MVAGSSPARGASPEGRIRTGLERKARPCCEWEQQPEETVVYAVVETGGHQYRAQVGDILEVEKLPYEAGEQVVLDRVLLLVDGERVQVGQPTVPGARVLATVLGEIKGPKIRIFKYRPRKRYRRRQGHRQRYTQLRVDQILLE